MDQQQLQIARAARWHQTAATDASAPLETQDAAEQWLDDAGFCLFLPRHAQLPAPAPSFVEACLGKPSLTPAPSAIGQAMELLTRLTGERRAVPLNLLGAFSEQPDFLVTPEVLPWVAAVRGDRQWKTAPGGRTTPIVIRTFEALDREGELTATALREILGREITEAAALRALLELWTGLRAMPVYAQGEATRWTLLKNRFAAQLATAANTAQPTALSALLSLYLRSAVAATAEEAEIFLSPLTARSRIREVLHGMMATRQLGMTTVASQTLLFVEGSLPETAPAPEIEPAKEAPARPPAATTPRPPQRKGPRPTRWELPAREGRPQQDQARPWQKKPAAADRGQPGAKRPWRASPSSSGPRPASGRASGFHARPGRPFGAGPGTGLRSGAGARADRPGGRTERPWERRGKDAFRGKSFGGGKFRKEDREAPKDRPAGEARPQREPRWRGSETGAPPFRKKPEGQGGRPVGAGRPQREPRWRGSETGAPPFRKKREGQEGRPWRDRPPARFGKDSGAKKDRPWRDRSERDRSGRNRPGRNRPGRNRPGSRPVSGGEGGGGSAPSGENRPPRPFRPGKPFQGKPSRAGKGGSRPFRAGNPKNKFRKPSPGERKSRKNRNQKESPE